MKLAILALFIVTNNTHSCWDITILQFSSPGEPHQPNGYAGMEDKVRKYLFKILID